MMWWVAALSQLLLMLLVCGNSTSNPSPNPTPLAESASDNSLVWWVVCIGGGLVVFVLFVGIMCKVRRDAGSSKYSSRVINGLMVDDNSVEVGKPN